MMARAVHRDQPGESSGRFGDVIRHGRAGTLSIQCEHFLKDVEEAKGEVL